MSNALIVVDVQNDFISGTLRTATGIRVAQRLSRHLRQGDLIYDKVVTTQDWHIDPGDHWSDTPDYKDSWPKHCEAGTEGAELHPMIADLPWDHQFRKGDYSAAYSGFEATQVNGPKLLEDWLRRMGVTDVDIVGIATDYCVKATAIDAARLGFKTRVLLPFCAAVDADEGLRLALQEMHAAGVEIVA